MKQYALDALQDAKRPLFSFYEISKHLEKLNYPANALRLMKNCNSQTGDLILSNCLDCGYSELKPVNYACNLRTCRYCAPKRSRRLFKKYNRLIQKENWVSCRGSKDSVYFLTISPKNYDIDNLKGGIEHIKASWKKFTRTKYIKERIKGGLWVVETKQNWKGKEIYDKFGSLLYVSDSDDWNIHIHSLFYGRRLDNAMRGFCNDCRQNYLKYDRFTKKFYCANRKCNSLNVEHKESSKIVKIFKECSGVDVNVDIKEFYSSSSALGYSLKYISQNEDSFENAYRMAEYIVVTKSQKLVSTFGKFYRVKFEKYKRLCPCCAGRLYHSFDRFLINMIIEERRKKLDEDYIKLIDQVRNRKEEILLFGNRGAIVPLSNSGSPIAITNRNI